MIVASFPGRSALVAGLVVLALSGCGRRGPLEPPIDPSAAAAERQKAAQRQAVKTAQGRPTAPAGQAETAPEGETNPPGQAQVADDGDADDPAAPSPAAGPAGGLTPPASSRKRARTPFVIPKEPFILDPLL